MEHDHSPVVDPTSGTNPVDTFVGVLLGYLSLELTLHPADFDLPPSKSVVALHKGLDEVSEERPIAFGDGVDEQVPANECAAPGGTATTKHLPRSLRERARLMPT